MPRRREVPKRIILQDPKFGSQEVSKFVNVLMTSGKKSVAESLLSLPGQRFLFVIAKQKSTGNGPFIRLSSMIKNMRIGWIEPDGFEQFSHASSALERSAASA